MKTKTKSITAYDDIYERNIPLERNKNIVIIFTFFLFLSSLSTVGMFIAGTKNLNLLALLFCSIGILNILIATTIFKKWSDLK